MRIDSLLVLPAAFCGSLARLLVAGPGRHGPSAPLGAALGLLGLRGYPVYLDGVQPPGDLDHGAAPEVPGEELQVDGGGHDDKAELGAARDDPVQQPQEQVGVEVPLVRLVDDKHVELVQAGVARQLSARSGVSAYRTVLG